jgi:hypothetical protein
MLESSSDLLVPTRADVEAKLMDLIEGRYTREEASSWAELWLTKDFEQNLIKDPMVLSALEALSGADMISTDRPYLYDEVDFRAWLDELRQA